MPTITRAVAAYAQRWMTRQYARRRRTRAAPRARRRYRRRGVRRRRGPRREQKYVTINVTSANETPTATLLTEVNQGVTNITRIGRTIFPKSIQVKGTLRINQAATTTRFRIVIVSDKFNNGSAPAWSDIMNHATDLVSLRNHQPQFMSRFRVLFDRLYTLDLVTDDEVVINWYKYLRGKIVFQGANGTDEGINALWMFTYGSELTLDPILKLKTRVRFTDQ